MRNLLACVLVGSAAGSVAMAQEAFTYSFDGRAGLGYLSDEAAEPLGDGYRYIGPVTKLELTGRAEIQTIEDLRFGALARVAYQQGDQSNYDLTALGSVTGRSQVEFGGSEVDIAVYAALPIVTLSYGDMETAFDLATREIEQGSSLLDGGNAVWMNLGDGAGSAGPRAGFPSAGPQKGPDLRTLRIDLNVGELSFSVSRSKGETTSGGEIEVDAAGAIWRHEVEGVSLFVGAGYDKGPMDRFHSFSFGFTSGGLNVVLNRVHRKPLVLNPAEPDFDTSFNGFSLSYDFGDVTLGVAHSSQSDIRNGVFKGTAKAAFASWHVREDISVDIEFSESNYTSGGDDAAKSSVALAWEF